MLRVKKTININHANKLLHCFLVGIFCKPRTSVNLNYFSAQKCLLTIESLFLFSRNSSRSVIMSTSGHVRYICKVAKWYIYIYKVILIISTIYPVYPFQCGNRLYTSESNVYTHNIGIEMKRKELTETFMMISNLTKPFGLPRFTQKYISIVRVTNTRISTASCQWLSTSRTNH